jgi:hypothetical protein
MEKQRSSSNGGLKEKEIERERQRERERERGFLFLSLFQGKSSAFVNPF